MEQHRKLKEPVLKIKIMVRTFKIIATLSFLFITGLHQHTSFTIIIIFLSIFSFIQSLFMFSSTLGWESFIYSILIMSTLVIFIRCKRFQDRYLQLFCFIVLTIIVILFTGVYNPENYKRIGIYFILPFLLFVISSVFIILINFKKSSMSKNSQN